MKAILLAEQLGAGLMLIDEWDGRHVAVKRGIKVTGTIGVLAAAAKSGLLDLPSAFSSLRRTNFRPPLPLMEQLLAEDASRKSKRGR